MESENEIQELNQRLNAVLAELSPENLEKCTAEEISELRESLSELRSAIESMLQ